jgi:Recombinase
MSEAELHVLRARLRGGSLHKAAKGELRLPLPGGFECDVSGRIRITPDEAVADAIATVFAYFDQLASARQVMLRLQGEQRRLPRKASADRQVRWATATYKPVHADLTNPVYAGAYPYRRKAHRAARRGRRGPRAPAPRAARGVARVHPRPLRRLQQLRALPGQPGPAARELAPATRGASGPRSCLPAILAGGGSLSAVAGNGLPRGGCSCAHRAFEARANRRTGVGSPPATRLTGLRARRPKVDISDLSAGSMVGEPCPRTGRLSEQRQIR